MHLLSFVVRVLVFRETVVILNDYGKLNVLMIFSEVEFHEIDISCLDHCRK